MTFETHFVTWWRLLNQHLAIAGQPEATNGDARYWWQASLSPDTAALRIAEYRAEEAQAVAS